MTQTRSSTRSLATYLNDHLAGANAGAEMARRLAGRAGPDVAVLSRLAEEIEEDREALKTLTDRLGEGSHPVKEAAGWLAAQVHRLAIDEAVTRDADLSMLLECETLLLGVTGKLALWDALAVIAPAHPQLDATALARLAERARGQCARLEAVRRDAALRAFTP